MDTGSYEEALELLDEESLDERRIHLCRNFGIKFAAQPNSKGISTRSRTTFLEPEAKTKRISRSAIPHIIRLLNHT